MKVSIPKTISRVSDPQSVNQLISSILANESEIDRDKEHFWLMGLTATNSIKYIELVHLGGLYRCPLDIKTIMRAAVNYGATSIIIAHNHPGGSCCASEDDKRCTTKLKEACEVLEICLLDHIIHCGKEYFSFKENHLI